MSTVRLKSIYFNIMVPEDLYTISALSVLLKVVPHGSVATDSLECSKIGTSILKKGGNAVDAVIASSFCLAVASPHTTGLDAEGQLLIYDHRTRKLPQVIDFTGPTLTSNLPRLVLGLAYTHREYGSLPWKDLVKPAAELAKDGYLISKMLVEAVARAKAEDLYGRLEPGQILKHENLSITLNNIANLSEEELYGYIEDKNQPILSEAIRYTFHNNYYDLYLPNTSSISQLIIAHLKEIEESNFTLNDTRKAKYFYELALKTQIFYEQQNMTENIHEGTMSNVAAIDLNEKYVSLVTGMYDLFGSGEMTIHGYILDSKLKEKNYSRIPLIITDANVICGRRMVLGASNLSTATQLIMYLLVEGKNATDSIEAPRFHILSNGTIGIEASHSPFFDDEVFKGLKPMPVKVPEPYASSNIVEKIKDNLSSHSDSRGGGIAKFSCKEYYSLHLICLKTEIVPIEDIWQNLHLKPTAECRKMMQYRSLQYSVDKLLSDLNKY